MSRRRKPSTPLLAVAFLTGALLPGASGQLPASTASHSREEYEAYALRIPGNVEHGRELFGLRDRTLCSQCHTVDGSSGLAGPDLFAIGDKFPRAELIRSVLTPSFTIAVGYGTTLISRKSGGDVMGVVKQATDNWVELKGIDGKPVRIESADIAVQQTLPTSLMPEGLYNALSLEDFADLIAYLESLRQPTGGTQRGNAFDEVPRARRPVALTPLFSEQIHLDHPVWIGEVPGHPDVFLALEHAGRIVRVTHRPDGDRQEEFLDIRPMVRMGGATGLLGLAFHPKCSENGKYYLKYQTQDDGHISTILEERQLAKDQVSDSGQPSRRLLQISAVTQDHNGGCIGFGPDGYLYLGMGDTGPQRDPQGHGQDMSLLLGKILRIDVDHTSGDLRYAIPADNPFRNCNGVRPEIWASGFREPWRFSWDSVTGDLWVGDVGQDRIEEVGIVRVGENHGWNVFEGSDAFSERYRRDGVNYVPPVFAYPHRIGVSVTGGYVYHGRRAPKFAGWYIFADFESRRIWALQQSDRKLKQVLEIGRAPTRAVSFMQQSDGELCLVGYDSGTIFQVDLSQADSTPLVTRSLLQTSERNPISWRYSLAEPSGKWTQPDFDDTAWSSVPGGFGTEGTPGAIVRTVWRTNDIWLRQGFSLDQKPAPASSVGLRIHHDEDAEVYINGILATRLPRWTTGYVEVPISAEAAASLRTGRNVISIHCHQQGGGQYIDAGLVEYTDAKPSGS